jgi:hypothetical protein
MLMELLQDNFDFGGHDSGKWDNWSSGNVIGTNDLYVKFTSTLSAGYYGWTSLSSYDLTGSYAFCQILSVGDQTIPSFEFYPISLDNGSNALSIMIAGGNIAARKKVSGVSSTVGDAATYNSDTMKWVRIRGSLGLIYWEYATDPTASWTIIASASNPITITSLTGGFLIGTWQNESSTTTAEIDNFNVLPDAYNFTWKGYTWQKRIHDGNPANTQQFSTDNIIIPNNANDPLILKFTNADLNTPVGAEFYSILRDFGYGEYTIVVDTRLDTMHAAAAFGGMYLFDFTGWPDYREIDVHETRNYDGNPNKRLLKNHTYKSGSDRIFVVSQMDIPSNQLQTHRLIWEPDKIIFDSYIGEGTSRVSYWHTEHMTNVPKPGQCRVHFNIWSDTSIAGYLAATPIDVTIKDFKFSKRRHVIKDYTQIYSGLGMNYYHESMGYNQLTNVQILHDLQSIKLACNKIKIYHNPYTNNGGITTGASLSLCQSITQIAKSLDMNVAWVVNVDNTGGYLTDANWNDYVTKVQLDADYAEEAGADEFFVGNEIYAHNNGDPGFTDLCGRIKSLVAATSFNGTISYQAISSEKNDWISSGLGDMTKLSINVYSDEASFKSIISSAYTAFGSSLEIGEFSTAYGYETVSPGDQSTWLNSLKKRVKIMNDIGIKTAYLFEWRNSSTTLYNFGLLRKNDIYPDINLAWQAMFEGRNFITI